MEMRHKKSMEWLNQSIALGTPLIDLVMLTKHLSVMLDAGMTVPEALDTIVDQANGGLKRVLSRVARRVDGGSTFGDALALEPRTFSNIFVSAAVIGESSGTLSENLRRLAIQMEKDLHLRRQIQAAALYPTIILSAAAVLGLGIATFVLPQVVEVFQSLNTDLPFTTRILIWVAEIFDAAGIWISLGFVAIVLMLVVIFRQPFVRPFTHRAMLSIPALKTFVHDINRARFCRTVGTLLESGTPITEALHIGTNVMSNVVYKKAVQQIESEVGSGEKLSVIIKSHEHLFSKMIVRMVAVGDQSGSLGKTLSYLATYYEDRVEAMSKNLSSIIEPVLLIIIGLIVGLIAISIITPIYSITSSIHI